MEQDLSTKREQRVWAIIDQLASKDKKAVDDCFDLLTWGWYGQQVLSQFSMGLSGYVFRQLPGSVRMSVKVVESGIPLVGFINSGTTTGCVRQFYDLLWDSRVSWSKDKYPWI